MSTAPCIWQSLVLFASCLKSTVRGSGRSLPDTSYSALLGSTVDTCYSSVLGWLLEEFHDFLLEGVHSAAEVDYVLLFSEVATLVVSTGTGTCCVGFSGLDAPRAVFPTIVGMRSST